ncbi:MULTISPECIES: universal stress protein [Anaeromyxobacter]|uniref:universal stress protein n=2 Tax=Anaeromyxobacteraceae TaxID=1524215 RepID=UPI001F58007C|nr:MULTISPECIES: universal stress protein [unclassified Anaeromyxobacter]
MRRGGAMRWIIGLDLRPRSHGALHFATWLTKTVPKSDERFIAVHVLEPEHLRAALKYHHLDELIAAARESGRRTLEREGAGERVQELEILEGMGADDGLIEALARHDADALLVGRIAGRSEAALVRLGRVARRLLRRLPAPVVVVPPDLETADIGGGPIVALTRLDESSTEACRFAGRFAAQTGRRLVLLHVVPYLELPFLAGASVDEIAREQKRAAEVACAAWIERLQLHVDEAVVEQGDVLDRADAIVEAREAPLLVVGASRRVALDRLATPSLARELAATAAVPVAVVPPRA